MFKVFYSMFSTIETFRRFRRIIDSIYTGGERRFAIYSGPSMGNFYYN